MRTAKRTTDTRAVHDLRRTVQEVWYVDHEVSDEARQLARELGFTRAATLADLENVDGVSESDLARTDIGKAVNRNHESILANAAALTILIEQRLVELNQRRPNSADALAALNTEVADRRMCGTTLTAFVALLLVTGQER